MLRIGEISDAVGCAVPKSNPLPRRFPQEVSPRNGTLPLWRLSRRSDRIARAGEPMYLGWLSDLVAASIPVRGDAVAFISADLFD